MEIGIELNRLMKMSCDELYELIGEYGADLWEDGASEACVRNWIRLQHMIFGTMRPEFARYCERVESQKAS